MAAQAIWAVAVALGGWLTPLGPAGPGPRSDRQPAQLDGVGVEEHLGARPSLAATMTDSAGVEVPLTAIVDGRRPTILTFNYSTCPMLCSLQLDGLVDGLRGLPQWRVGEHFNMATVSIDPEESQARAAGFKQKYLDQFRQAGASAGWWFLRGRLADVERLANEVGFHYKYVPEQKEWAHTAAVVVLSPDGVVSRYLYGVLFEPRDLRLALAEAAQGRVGSTLERILLYCFHYDAAAGRYAPMASNIMRLAAATTVLALAAMLGLFWLRDRRRHPVSQS